MEPHKTLTKQEFETWATKARKEEEGKLIVVTPEEDTKLIEKILDKPAGSFGESLITIRGDQTKCSNCGRQTSFLDILNDGLDFHGKEFINGVLDGKRGYVYNPNPPRPHKCYECKQESSVSTPIYVCTWYGCG